MKGLRINNPWVLIHFALLFIFILLRAIHVPLVADEAFTFFLYVEPETVFFPAAQIDANNHYLNSLLSIGSIKLFGTSLFAFRLPNVLSFVIYYFAAYKIAQYSVEKWRFWIALIAFTSIYPLLEFFSLSRGYGISFAFLLTAIYHTMAFVEDKRPWRAWWILLLIIFTLFAQLSLLFASAAILLLVLVKYISSNWPSKKFMSFGYALLCIFVLLAFTLHIKGLQDGAYLYFGERDRFPLYNIISLNELLFQISGIWMYYITLSLFIVGIACYLLILFKNKLNIIQKREFVFPFVLLSSIIGIVLAIYLLNGTGPLARTALYLYLLLLGTWISISSILIFFRYSTAIILVVFSTMSFYQINTSQVNYWQSQRIDSEVFDLLEQHYCNNCTLGCSIYLESIYQVEANYFRSGNKSISVIEQSIKNYDLVLLSTADRERFATELESFQLLYRVENGVSLYKNKIDSKFYNLNSIEQTFESSNQEFINVLSHFYTDSTNNPKSFILDGDLTCKMTSKTASWNLVVQFFDNDGGFLHARYYPINRFGKNWNSGKSTECHLPIMEIPIDTKEIRIYLYNPLKLNFDWLKVHARLKGAFPNP
jgi:hypothetical protein